MVIMMRDHFKGSLMFVLNRAESFSGKVLRKILSNENHFD